MPPLADAKDFDDEGDDVVATGEDEDEDVVELDGVSSIDDDEVPHQKITIDNKVCFSRCLQTLYSYMILLRMRWSAFGIVSS
jgi:hypothetical protein